MKDEGLLEGNRPGELAKKLIGILEAAKLVSAGLNLVGLQHEVGDGNGDSAEKILEWRLLVSRFSNLKGSIALTSALLWSLSHRVTAKSSPLLTSSALNKTKAVSSQTGFTEESVGQQTPGSMLRTKKRRRPTFFGDDAGAVHGLAELGVGENDVRVALAIAVLR